MFLNILKRLRGQALVEEMHQGGLFNRGERGKQLVMHA